MDALQFRRAFDFGPELSQTGWYHSMDFDDGEIIQGYMPLEVQRGRYAEFPIPADLSGKRVLDVGAWDGWFSFEAERHGAEVVALDCARMDNFVYAHARKRSNVKYVIAEVYDLPSLGLGTFDYVFFLGVLYHLRHPLLALEYVCAATREIAIVDSFVTDEMEAPESAPRPPAMEFYETDELGGNIDNWFGPTLDCLHALVRSGGFARTEFLSLWHRHARLACYRRWPAGARGVEGPAVAGAVHARNYGINFSSGREEYVSCWFTSGAEELTRGEIMIEIGGFGAAALTLRRDGNAWQANVRLPPGLAPGAHDVRLRLPDTDFGPASPIFVGCPPIPGRISILGFRDGKTWAPDALTASKGTSADLSLWVSGLAANSDVNNVEAVATGPPCHTIYVGIPNAQGIRQINLRCAAPIPQPSIEVALRQSLVLSTAIKAKIL